MMQDGPGGHSECRASRLSGSRSSVGLAVVPPSRLNTTKSSSCFHARVAAIRTLAAPRFSSYGDGDDAAPILYLPPPFRAFLLALESPPVQIDSPTARLYALAQAIGTLKKCLGALLANQKSAGSRAPEPDAALSRAGRKRSVLMWRSAKKPRSTSSLECASAMWSFPRLGAELPRRTLGTIRIVPQATQDPTWRTVTRQPCEGRRHPHHTACDLPGKASSYKSKDLTASPTRFRLFRGQCSPARTSTIPLNTASTASRAGRRRYHFPEQWPYGPEAAS
ncbi:hypothetical protein EDB92DRAFT_1917334 [Lactarius akahatsu]|uniref:Uncharacterized protein n=1 Tax=Lactarius akahatsu TaxID=416441 RepID=A0AAD4L2J6_9AGAM|nr:hypothetical protein EDB92DRAFT_1917334 [Lactarius akahatsu]